MGFTDAIKTRLNKYATFDGRASRSEYWYFVLFYFLLLLAATIVDKAIVNFPVFQTILVLALIVPHIAVAVRRLHDSDRAGGWIFVCLVPIIGGIVLLVWLCTRESPTTNRFGPAVLPNA
jgi:uncharacterized membrane protein YhaH (DUF805 family)